MKSLRKTLLERLVQRRPQDALYLTAAQLHIRCVSMALPLESPLYAEGVATTVELPLDHTIAPYVLAHGHWQDEEINFIRQHAPQQPAVLFDVGANVGLVTRQLLHTVPQLQAAVAFEPHPFNYQVLKRNTAHLPQCHALPLALGAEDGEFPFFTDDSNAGNYSLLADAMRQRTHGQTVVQCRRATEDALYAPLTSAQRTLPVAWKSDTQGFDELIATTLPLAFWQKVQVGVMEVARLNRPAFDGQRLAQLLDSFAIRRWSHEPERQVSTEEVLAFARGTDDQHSDLYFARA